MEGKRSDADRVAGLEGTDAGALGTDEAPESAPAGAEVIDEEHRVPGATFADRPHDEAKPWFTSLAAESEQAGVANDPPEAQEPEFPTAEEDPP